MPFIKKSKKLTQQQLNLSSSGVKFKPNPLAENTINFEPLPSNDGGSVYLNYVDDSTVENKVNYYCPKMDAEGLKKFASNPVLKRLFAIGNQPNTPNEDYFFLTVLNTVPFRSEMPNEDAVIFYFYLPDSTNEFTDDNKNIVNLPLMAIDDGERQLSQIRSHLADRYDKDDVRQSRPIVLRQRLDQILSQLDRPALAWIKWLPNYQQFWLRIFKAVSGRYFKKLATIETKAERSAAFNDNLINWLNLSSNQRLTAKIPNHRNQPSSADCLIGTVGLDYVTDQIVRLMFSKKSLADVDLLGTRTLLERVEQICRQHSSIHPDIEATKDDVLKFRDGVLGRGIERSVLVIETDEPELTLFLRLLTYTYVLGQIFDYLLCCLPYFNLQNETFFKKTKKFLLNNLPLPAKLEIDGNDLIRSTFNGCKNIDDNEDRQTTTELLFEEYLV